jgi:hypothetical protein
MLKAAREKLGNAKEKLAGKYGQLMDQAAANPSAAAAIGAAGALGLGAAGSLVGNLVDAEQGEGPLRLLTEAANAGLNAAPLGALGLGAAAFNRRLATNPALYQQFAEGFRDSSGMVNASKLDQALQRMKYTPAASAAAIPLAAGLGGMLGGGTSNMYASMGVPGFNPGTIPNPEDPTLSSNSEGARYKAPTTQYA